MFIRFLVLAVLVSSVAQAAAPDYPRGQLPETIAPTHYALDLTILPERETFDGKVTIAVEIAEPTDTIWFHGQELTVTAATVTGAGNQKQSAAYDEIPGSGGVARLTLDKPIAAGPATIEVVYSAPFNRRLEGLYRSDEGGDSYAFSQMEPIFARLAFPSFDEPRFKTPFDVAVTAHAEHVVVSNTPETKVEQLANGLKRVTFLTTKPLPTYLIAFAVGPLDVVDWTPIRATAIRDVPIPLRGITARGKGEQMKYALENTEGLLLTLEGYFDIPYPYEKLDLVAATDFAAGAMENAGAIFYREPLLLLGDNPSLSEKRFYAIVHAHEMAHQWFGDLVTPVWWNDIWLNEAFASWMENLTADRWNPEGEYDRLNLKGALGAMNIDSWRSARQIAQPIESNDDIANAFDGITYEKGGGVISMFERYYGAENFRRGVKLHMERFRFGVATSKDFLQSIADASNDTEGVAAFETFLNQPGVPTLKTSLTCRKSGASVDVTQSRYSVDPKGPATDQRWIIPLCVVTGNGGERNSTCTMVKDRKARIAIEGTACPDWVMPNADGAAYARFSFDRQGWQNLFAHAEELNAKEKLSALDSLDAAFGASTIDIAVYAEGIRALLGDTTAVMPEWDVAALPVNRLGWISDQLVRDDAKPGVARFVADLYGPIYDRLGLDPNRPYDRENEIKATLMRTPVVGVMAEQIRRADVRAELAKRGAAYLGIGGDGTIDEAAVDPSQVQQALIVAVQDLGAPAVNAIRAHLKTERKATTRNRMISALTHSTDPEVAAATRALALSDELRGNEVPIVVYGSVREPDNAAAAWTWFKANFDAIAAKMPPNNRGELAGIGSRFCSKNDRKDYNAFFSSRIDDLTGGPRNLAITLERIDACVNLVEKQRRAANKYFAALVP
ncbi:MAG: M1 family metallopeptidase [Rhodobacteraceae bacterium]|nr:M1 family metallopeptidase [Paracoccaceae bacterium]